MIPERIKDFYHEHDFAVAMACVFVPVGILIILLIAASAEKYEWCKQYKNTLSNLSIQDRYFALATERCTVYGNSDTNVYIPSPVITPPSSSWSR